MALLANDGQYEGLQMMKPESVALMEAVNETQLPDGSYQGLSIRCRKDIYGREPLFPYWERLRRVQLYVL